MEPLAADRDRTRLLAEEMSGLAYEALAPEDVEQVKRLLLDHVGVAWRGSDMPWSRALAGWAATLGNGNGNGSGSAIVGTPARAAPSIAALVNAAAAHGMELDDTHDESLSHPGAPVIATALAVGTATGATGEAVIAAIVAGYEVMARAGMAAGAADIIEHGFHPTALFGGFGAATAAAKLYGLDAAGMAAGVGTGVVGCRRLHAVLAGRERDHGQTASRRLWRAARHDGRRARPARHRRSGAGLRWPLWPLCAVRPQSAARAPGA